MDKYNKSLLHAIIAHVPLALIAENMALKHLEKLLFSFATIIFHSTLSSDLDCSIFDKNILPCPNS